MIFPWLAAIAFTGLTVEYVLISPHRWLAIPVGAIALVFWLLALARMDPEHRRRHKIGRYL